jgi:L-threonylcarbamoyladenylate synthase
MVINAKGKNNLSLLEKGIIKNALNLSEVIAFPTDTVYGLGANGLLKDSVKKIYKIKQRDKEKPLILFLTSIEEASDYIEEPELLKNNIFKKYWPGPLTAVFEKKKSLTLYYSAGESTTIGIRIPSFPLILDLLTYCKIPLVTTSANISGSHPFKNGFEIEKGLNNKDPGVPLTIDYGDLLERESSTVVSVTKEGIKVLRAGAIKIIAL